ncbi:hypothetical protein NHX12_030633, partial [Muraenolepis orangiensis]
RLNPALQLVPGAPLWRCARLRTGAPLTPPLSSRWLLPRCCCLSYGEAGLGIDPQSAPPTLCYSWWTGPLSAPPTVFYSWWMGPQSAPPALCYSWWIDPQSAPPTLCYSWWIDPQSAPPTLCYFWWIDPHYSLGSDNCRGPGLRTFTAAAAGNGTAPVPSHGK